MMPNLSSRATYSRLSSFYFFYFAFFGSLLPYAGLYFQSLGFNAVEIGQLMAIFVGTKIVAPNIFGWLADKTGLRIFWVRLCSFLAVLSGVGLVVFTTFWPIFSSILAFSFFFHAALPQFESFTFSTLHNQKSRYGRIRLWGSIGFIIAVLWVGWLLEYYPVALLPSLLALILGAILVTSLLVSDAEKEVYEHSGLHWWHIVKQPAVMGLLWVSLLINLSHGAYYSFYSIFLSEAGYGKTTIAWLWSLGVIAEIGIFIWMGNLFQRFSIRELILVTLILTSVCWWLIPLFVDSIAILIFAQILHALSYGLFHAAAISLTDHHFQGRHQGQGQALYAAISNGVGGSLGMLMAGYAWFYGGAIWAFGLSAVVVVVAFLIGSRTLQK